jgi:hypothetical protein
MSEKQKEFYPASPASSVDKTPTNRHAAKRPYCYKHHRAMLDIGGEKKCVVCMEEKTKKTGE